jgi:hypothetical protein
MIFTILTLTVCSCTVNQVDLGVLSKSPMKGTWISCYPTIETIYESDDEITVLASWGNIPESEGHTLKWEFCRNDGTVILQKSINNANLEPYTYYRNKFRIDTVTKDTLDQGTYQVNFHIDEKLVSKQDIQYVEKSIRNLSIKNTVILPFSYTLKGSRFSKKKDAESISNTVADAIYCEVKRIFPYTTHHSRSGVEIGEPYSLDCFENSECLESIKDKFGTEDIIITGNITLPEYIGEAAWLTVLVYDPATGEKKEFIDTGSGYSYYHHMLRSLLFEVMYSEGLLEYLKNYKRVEHSRSKEIIQDGVFIAYANVIVRDISTGLE